MMDSPIRRTGAGSSLTGSTESLSKAGDASLMTPNSTGQLVLPKTANFLNQLEQMMGAVKKEASALEGMKSRLKDMEELKQRYSDAKQKLSESESDAQELRRRLRDIESINAEQRQDMQKLNNMFNADRTKYMELQQGHARLTQELNSTKMERDFLKQETLKIPELKKGVKALKAQMHQMKSEFEEEKLGWQQNRTELERKITKADSAKNDLSQHLWRMTEEMESLKTELESQQQQYARLQSGRGGAEQLIDRLMMSNEDYVAFYSQRTHRTHYLEMEVDNLRQDNEEWRRKFFARDAEAVTLLTQLQQVKEKDSEHQLHLQSKLQKTSESAKEIVTRMQSLEQEKGQLQILLITKSDENKHLTEENTQLRSSLQAMELNMNQREMELAVALKGVATQRDELAYQLTATQSERDTLANQLKVDSTKYWEEVRGLKQSEAELLEESDRLTQELQEMTLKCHTLETEKRQSSAMIQAETHGNLGATQALRDELEKRISELMGLRSDRDTLNQSLTLLTKDHESLKQELIRSEALFKRTVETERSKWSNELTARSQRIKTLESEKSELLQETQELMFQVNEAQQQVKDTKIALEEEKNRNSSTADQHDLVRGKYLEQANELRRLITVDEENKEKIRKLETQHREEIFKLEQELKEHKRQSSQQVIDLTKQIKSLFDDADELRQQTSTSSERERQFNLEKDRLNQSIQLLNEQLAALHESSSNSNSTLKRELMDLRSKHKLTIESRTKLEMELISQRMESSRLESDYKKSLDTITTHENDLNQLQERLKSLRDAHDTLTTSNKQWSNRVTELESAIVNRDKALESSKNDIQALERDSMVEIRRLRLLLSTAEQELSETKAMQEQLAIETHEAKTSLARQQSLHASTHSKLHDEIKTLEEQLTREKRVKQSEVDDLRRICREHERTVEKLRQENDEFTLRIKADRNDRDTRVESLDAEVERLRGTLRDRNDHIEKLETNAQQTRRRGLELKEKLDAMESEAADLRSRFEQEALQRRRLEARVKSLQQQLQQVVTTNADGMSATIGSRTNSATASQWNQQYNNSSDAMTILSGDNNDLDRDNITSAGGMLTARSGLSSSSGPRGMLLQPIPVNNNSNLTAHEKAIQILREKELAREWEEDPYNDDNLMAATPRRAQQQPSISSASLAMPNASPALDRVSAALALRLAQHSRNTHAAASTSSQQSLSLSVSANGSRPCSAGTLRSPSNRLTQQQRQFGSGSDADTIKEQRSAVEETIMRTQRALERRAQQKQEVAGTASSSNSSKPRQGLQESIQLAQAMYDNNTASSNNVSPVKNSRTPAKQKQQQQQQQQDEEEMVAPSLSMSFNGPPPPNMSSADQDTAEDNDNGYEEQDSYGGMQLRFSAEEQQLLGMVGLNNAMGGEGRKKKKKGSGATSGSKKSSSLYR